LPIDFTTTFRKAEEFFRRSIKPKAVQAAEKRQSERRNRNAGRRLRRAATAAGASGAGVAGIGIAVAPIGTVALMAAGGAALLAAGAALFWPLRPPGAGRISHEELTELLLDAEQWLLEHRKTIPMEALAPLDRIFQRIDDIHSHVQTLEPNGSVAWDLRRMIADHLPRLIDAYAGLPSSVREADAELLPRLIDGLETCDHELIRLCHEASAAHLHGFQVQNRFLETRYGEDPRLKAEGGDAR
jgi:hypothetical protein